MNATFTKFFEHASTAAKEALGKLSEDQLQAIVDTGIEVVPPPSYAPDYEPMIWVKECKSLPNGAKAKLRWTEANLDEATLKLIEDERKKQCASATQNDLPIPHITLLFGHNPECGNVRKRKHWDSLPKKEMKFEYMTPLGPPGNKFAWGLYCQDQDLYASMAGMQADAQFYPGNKDFDASSSSWPVPGGLFPDIKPHATFVRGVKDLDLDKPPSMRAFKDHAFRLSSVTEQCGFAFPVDSSDVKLKFCTHFDL